MLNTHILRSNSYYIDFIYVYSSKIRLPTWNESKPIQIRRLFFFFQKRICAPNRHQIWVEFYSNVQREPEEAKRIEQTRFKSQQNHITNWILFLCVVCLCIVFGIMPEACESLTKQEYEKNKKICAISCEKKLTKDFFSTIESHDFSVRFGTVHCFQAFPFFSFRLSFGWPFHLCKNPNEFMNSVLNKLWKRIGPRQCHTSTNTVECTIENDGTTVWPVGSFDLVCRLRRRRRRHRRRRLQRAILHKVRSKCMPNIR